MKTLKYKEWPSINDLWKDTLKVRLRMPLRLRISRGLVSALSRELSKHWEFPSTQDMTRDADHANEHHLFARLAHTVATFQTPVYAPALPDLAA